MVQIRLSALLLIALLAVPLAACGGGRASVGESRQALIAEHFGNRRLAAIEGIWSSSDRTVEIAIVDNAAGKHGDGRFVALVTQWEKGLLPRTGNVLMRLDPTGEPNVYLGSYHDGVVRSQGITLVQSHAGVLQTQVAVRETGTNLIGQRIRYERDQRLSFIRTYPNQAEQSASTARRGGTGSGFMIAKGIAATNEHVVGRIQNIAITLDSRKLNGRVLITDKANDLALVQVFDAAGQVPDHACLPVASAAGAETGERIYAFGYPLSSVLGREIRLTEGLITAGTGLQNDPRLLQISAQIQPGNSGGPVTDASGRLMGIATSSLVSRTLQTQNVNFAVKRDYLDLLARRYQLEPCAHPILPGAPQQPHELVRLIQPAVIFVENPGE